MSNIIKFFRVIEGNDLVFENIDQEHQTLQDEQINELLKETRKKSERIISQANKEAEKIIDSANEEYDKQLNIAYEKAKSIFEENKKSGYDEGFQTGKQQGYSEGYDKGYTEGKEEAKKLINEALEIKDSYIQKRSQLLKESEHDLIELVISIYEKVLHKNVEEDKELIVSLVLKGIEDLEIKDNLTVIVSKEDYDVINKHKDIILAKASLLDKIDIRINSDMSKGECMLETSKGNIDVSISNQLREVKELIISILNNE